MTTELIRAVAGSVSEGQVAYVGDLNGYAVSVQKVNGQALTRIDAHRDAGTTEVYPVKDVPEGTTSKGLLE